MNYKEMLNQPRIKMRYSTPSPLVDLIKNYQEAERILYKKRAKNKEELVTLMMMIGQDKFIIETNQMINQIQNK